MKEYWDSSWAQRRPDWKSITGFVFLVQEGPYVEIAAAEYCLSYQPRPLVYRDIVRSPRGVVNIKFQMPSSGHRRPYSQLSRKQRMPTTFKGKHIEGWCKAYRLQIPDDREARPKGNGSRSSMSPHEITMQTYLWRQLEEHFLYLPSEAQCSFRSDMHFLRYMLTRSKAPFHVDE